MTTASIIERHPDVSKAIHSVITSGGLNMIINNPARARSYYGIDEEELVNFNPVSVLKWYRRLMKFDR